MSQEEDPRRPLRNQRDPSSFPGTEVHRPRPAPPRPSCPADPQPQGLPALGQVIQAVGGHGRGEESGHLRWGGGGAVKAGAQREGRGGRGQQRPGRQLQLLQLGLLQSLGLGPEVLKPDLDLRLGETQAAGECGALGDGQVLLLTEPTLQRQQLRGGEGRPRLAVGLVLAQGAGRRTQPP